MYYNVLLSENIGLEARVVRTALQYVGRILGFRF